jgi:hypothetical protein
VRHRRPAYRPRQPARGPGRVPTDDAAPRGHDGDRPDKYAGETFIHDFGRHGIAYDVAALTASQCYEALEPHLNGARIVLLDDPELESEFLGLVWRLGKIDHQPGEHDDRANAAAGALLLALDGDEPVDLSMSDAEHATIRRIFAHPGEIWGLDPDDVVGTMFDPVEAATPYT